MKTAIDKNESELEKMKRESLEWLERYGKVAPPFISVAVNSYQEKMKEVQTTEKQISMCSICDFKNNSMNDNYCREYCPNRNQNVIQYTIPISPCKGKTVAIYTLNCDKCGNAFLSKEAFPKPQLCNDCIEKATPKQPELTAEGLPFESEIIQIMTKNIIHLRMIEACKAAVEINNYFAAQKQEGKLPTDEDIEKQFPTDKEVLKNNMNNPNCLSLLSLSNLLNEMKTWNIFKQTGARWMRSQSVSVESNVTDENNNKFSIPCPQCGRTNYTFSVQTDVYKCNICNAEWVNNK